MSKPMRKRLFLDIETSPNIGLFWKPGHNVSIGYENIIQERKIICVAWAWENEDRVRSMVWSKEQSDRKLVKHISGLLNEADEIVAHNGDAFDLPWIRARCLYHNIALSPHLVTHDTCALARRYFDFNSNRLDYLGGYTGAGHKMETTYGLWKRVLLEKDGDALRKMREYNEKDVILLMRVWERLKPYIPAKTHATGVVRECPECGSDRMVVDGHRVSAAGHKKVKLVCKDCGKYHTVAAGRF